MSTLFSQACLSQYIAEHGKKQDILTFESHQGHITLYNNEQRKSRPAYQAPFGNGYTPKGNNLLLYSKRNLYAKRKEFAPTGSYSQWEQILFFLSGFLSRRTEKTPDNVASCKCVCSPLILPYSMIMLHLSSWRGSFASCM